MNSWLQVMARLGHRKSQHYFQHIKRVCSNIRAKKKKLHGFRFFAIWTHNDAVYCLNLMNSSESLSLHLSAFLYPMWVQVGSKSCGRITGIFFFSLLQQLQVVGFITTVCKAVLTPSLSGLFVSFVGISTSPECRALQLVRRGVYFARRIEIMRK